MIRQTLQMLLAIAVLACSGCGTFLSTRDNKERPVSCRTYIYSGVRFDGQFLGNLAEWTLPWWLQGLIILDIPLSAVADTIALPYTIYAASRQPRAVMISFGRSDKNGDAAYIGDLHVWIHEGRQSGLGQKTTPDQAAKAIESIHGPIASAEALVYCENGALDMSLQEYGAVIEPILKNKTLILNTDSCQDIHARYMTARSNKAL